MFWRFYTRNGLDLKQRELITLCAISTLGGCENIMEGLMKSLIHSSKIAVNNPQDYEATHHEIPFRGIPLVPFVTWLQALFFRFRS